MKSSAIATKGPRQLQTTNTPKEEGVIYNVTFYVPGQKFLCFICRQYNKEGVNERMMICANEGTCFFFFR